MVFKRNGCLGFIKRCATQRRATTLWRVGLRLGDKLNIRELSTPNSLCFSQVKVEMRTAFASAAQLV